MGQVVWLGIRANHRSPFRAAISTHAFPSTATVQNADAVLAGAPASPLAAFEFGSNVMLVFDELLRSEKHDFSHLFIAFESTAESEFGEEQIQTQEPTLDGEEFSLEIVDFNFQKLFPTLDGGPKLPYFLRPHTRSDSKIHFVEPP
jgi:hypothetical protein